MKIKLFCILLTFCIFYPQNIDAITATPSAIPTTNMADQVKQLVKDNLATTEAKLKEKVDLQSLVGYVGKITTLSSGNLTFESHGNLIQTTTNTKTAFLKNGSVIKFTSLAIDDKIITIGTSVKDGIVSAKRITVINDEPILVKTTAQVGKISSIDLKKKTITLNLEGKDSTFSLSKKSTVQLDEFKAGQTILGITKEYNGGLSISRAKIL